MTSDAPPIDLSLIRSAAIDNILNSPVVQQISGKTPNAAQKLALHETLHTPTNLIGSPHRVRPKTPSTNHSTSSHQSSAHPDNEEQPKVFGQEQDAEDSELEITDVDEADETYIADIQNLNELSQLKGDLLNETAAAPVLAASSSNTSAGVDLSLGLNVQSSNTNLPNSGPSTALSVLPQTEQNQSGSAPTNNLIQQAILALKNQNSNQNNTQHQNLPPAAVAAALTSRLNFKNQVNSNLLNSITAMSQSQNLNQNVNPAQSAQAAQAQAALSQLNQQQLMVRKLEAERQFSHLKRKRDNEFEEDEEEEKKPHVKKPLNAFMLFMKEQRQKVVNECTLKESAAINQILGRKWHNLSKEEQQKYYDEARRAREKHLELYPELEFSF